jgi:hypothetical protein
MPSNPANQELDALIARQEMIIKAAIVAKAIHEVIEDLDAANAIEERLEQAGYEQTKRGDWYRF